jgi:hypothetical protein
MYREFQPTCGETLNAFLSQIEAERSQNDQKLGMKDAAT